MAKLSAREAWFLIERHTRGNLGSKFLGHDCHDMNDYLVYLLSYGFIAPRVYFRMYRAWERTPDLRYHVCGFLSNPRTESSD